MGVGSGTGGTAAALFALFAACTGCATSRPAERTVITFPSSAVGAEARVLRDQVARFTEAHPDVEVELVETPDAADERRQLFVQWLNAGVGKPDVLQLDVIWTPELAAAGWLLPLERFDTDTSGFFPNVIDAARYDGRLYALPWFVDVGMLYWRTDLLDHPPDTFDELADQAREAMARNSGVESGFVWQGARYEGLITVFLEVAGGFGASLERRGPLVSDSEPAVAALSWMHRSVHGREAFVPRTVLTWQEEQARFAFQNGKAVFMRNWPYAWRLLSDPERSKVAGKFSVAPMPATAEGQSTAALGGQQLGINAHSDHPEAAYELMRFLTAPEQMIERMRVTGQLPAREPLYDDPRLADAGGVPPQQAREIIRRATPRPTSPVYSAMSEILQIHLHRALAGQVAPRDALGEAAQQMTARHDGFTRRPEAHPVAGRIVAGALWTLLCAAVLVAVVRMWRGMQQSLHPRSVRQAWLLVTPAVASIGLVAAFPLGWTAWESLHVHDLRRPDVGRVFVGFDQYQTLAGDDRFWSALGHTVLFTASSVTLELLLGFAVALVLNRTFRARSAVRAVALLPWALPTVVAGLVWRFVFEGRRGLANQLLEGVGAVDAPVVWFSQALTAWVPIILADVWKTTPFVALLLLAGLQTIDDRYYDAARVDGAGAVSRFLHVTLPMLRPTLLVVLLFRSLDAFRVFGLIYVLTGGGPGTSTEPVSIHAFSAMLQDLRFGYGSAISVAVFAVAFAIAMIYLRALGPGGREG